MLTIHSMKPIAVQIEEALPSGGNNFDSLVNRIIAEKFGKEVEKRPG